MELFAAILSSEDSTEDSVKLALGDWSSMNHLYKMKGYLERQLLGWLASQRHSQQIQQAPLIQFKLLVERGMVNWANELLWQAIERFELEEDFDMAMICLNEFLAVAYIDSKVDRNFILNIVAKMANVSSRQSELLEAINTFSQINHQSPQWPISVETHHFEEINNKITESSSQKAVFFLRFSLLKLFFMVRNFEAISSLFKELKVAIDSHPYLLDDHLILIRYVDLQKIYVMLKSESEGIEPLMRICEEIYAYSRERPELRRAILQRYFQAYSVIANSLSKDEVDSVYVKFQKFSDEKDEFYSDNNNYITKYFFACYFFRECNFRKAKELLLEVGNAQEQIPPPIFLSVEILLMVIVAEDGDADFVSHLLRRFRYFREKVDGHWPRGVELANELVKLAEAKVINRPEIKSVPLSRIAELIMEAANDDYTNVSVNDLLVWLGNRKATTLQ